MTKVLFIDDERVSVKPAMRRLTKDDGIEVDLQESFSEAETALMEWQPDIVVLDVIDHGESGDQLTPGRDVFDKIWSNHCCPVIVYSAFPNLLTDQHDSHPFVTSVTKGQDLSMLEEAVRSFRPHVDALRRAKAEVTGALTIAMRDVAPLVFNAFGDVDHQVAAVVRSGRRHVAALMDMALLTDDSPLASWEQYLLSTIGDNVLMGDILKIKDAPDDPENHRVVLTASCDMVRRGMPPKAKVENILVAQCVDLSVLRNHSELRHSNEGEWQENIRKVLTQGYHRNLLPLPGMGQVIPGMVADFRKLELIPIDSLFGDKQDYERVASVDSPFRELISWAYMQTACRPGLPERDADTWSAEILGDTKPEKEGDQ